MWAGYAQSWKLWVAVIAPIVILGLLGTTILIIMKRAHRYVLKINVILYKIFNIMLCI